MSIGRRMVAGKQGMEVLQNDDTLSYVFYAPIKTGWSVATVCPREEVFASLDKIQLRVVAIVCAGLVLLALVCARIIRHVVTPLSRFAGAARQIAGGDFNVPLPQSKYKDEMGQLHDAFEYMQKALVEYMDRLRRTTAQKERIESELRIASDIQMGMIPKLFPPFPERKDIDLFAVLKPAKEVGGDLYDFFIHEGKLIFVIGDVSGKGVPASLLMAVTRSLFRTIAVHRDRACEIVGALNRAVSDNNESNMFITLFLGILDLGTGRLVYCNAGHNPPVLSGREEEPHFLACTSNIPIGVFGDFEYEEEYLDLGFERMLLLYTDGLTEAENRDSSLYSEARLLSTMQTLRGLSARETVETLEESVRTFAGGAEQSDDLTMLALGRLLPVRKSQEDALENVSDYTVELLVPTECPHVGKTVEEAGLYNVEGGHIIEIIRFDHEIISPVSKDEFIFGGDRLIFSGDVARILELKKTHQLVNATHHVFALNEVEGNRRL